MRTIGWFSNWRLISTCADLPPLDPDFLDPEFQNEKRNERLKKWWEKRWREARIKSKLIWQLFLFHLYSSLHSSCLYPYSNWISLSALYSSNLYSMLSSQLSISYCLLDCISPLLLSLLIFFLISTSLYFFPLSPAPWAAMAAFSLKRSVFAAWFSDDTTFSPLR